jgi:hypothetical protein
MQGFHHILLDICKYLMMQSSIWQMLRTQNDIPKGSVRRGYGQVLLQERDSSYSYFLATHLPVFVDATDPLKADNWLHTTESKFGLLHCTEYQKTLYVA